MSRLHFSQFWGNPFLSDLSIQLHAPGDNHATHLTLPGHAVVLCQASPLLQQLVELEVDDEGCPGNMKGDGVVSSHASPRKAAAAAACGALGPGMRPRCARGVLRLPIDAQDIDAAVLVMHGMYDPLVMAHPEVEARPELLVAALRLADLLQADGVLVAAAKALEGVASWGRSVVMGVLELPPPLLTTRAARALHVRARGELLSYFREFDTAWAAPELRGFFLHLPPDAVEWLLGHPDLIATSENTPFVAATDWVECGRGVSATPGQLSSLLGSLRLGSLSHSFFHSQVLSRPWVRVAADALAASQLPTSSTGSSSGASLSSIRVSMDGRSSSGSSGGSTRSSSTAGPAIGPIAPLPSITTSSTASGGNLGALPPGQGVVQLASLYCLANTPYMVEASGAVGALGTSQGLPHWVAAEPRDGPLSPTCIVVQLPLHLLRDQVQTLDGRGNGSTSGTAGSTGGAQGAGRGAPNTSQPAGGRLPPLGRAGRYSAPPGASSSSAGTLTAFSLEGLGMVSALNSTVVRTVSGNGNAQGSAEGAGSGSGAGAGDPSVSSPNLVPSPTVVWGGYVWALDVFVARDPDIVLGASVHALYPAFGLPAVQPPPRITTTNIPLTPTASPHSTAPGGGTTLNAAGAARTASDEDTDDSDSSPVLPLPPLTRIRGRHTYTGSEPIPGLNNSSFSGARGPVPRSISSASAYALSQAPSRTSSLDPTPQPDTRYPTRTTSSTSGEKAICGSSDAAAVPLVTPPEPALRAPPPAPAPLTSPRWAVQAEVRLAVWDAEVEAWSPIYTQLLTSNTGLEFVPQAAGGEGGGVAPADKATRSPTTPYHASNYRVTYTDYYPVWGQHALRKLLYEPTSWQRTAYAPDGRLLLRAELVRVR